MIAQSLSNVVSENLVAFRVIGILKTIMFPFEAPLSTITIIVYKGSVRGILSLCRICWTTCCLILFSPFLGGGAADGHNHV